MAENPKETSFSPMADLRLRRAPFWIVASIMILVVLTWVPLVWLVGDINMSGKV